MQQATGIILAGGKGRRINKDKALITLSDGTTLIQKCIEALKKAVPDILIVANSREPYQDCGARVVEDLIKNKGPLGGIFTGLCYSASYHNLVVGCDMPFPQPRLVELLFSKCDDQDVVIPETRGEVEPLFAVYSKSCLPTIVNQLRNNDLKIRHVLRTLKVETIHEAQIDAVDPQHLSFFNVNTTKDLRRAEALLSLMAKRA